MTVDFIVISVLLFQFHKGTIKTKNRAEYQVYTHLFQFHKGTIKTILLLLLMRLILISIP